MRVIKKIWRIIPLRVRHLISTIIEYVGFFLHFNKEMKYKRKANVYIQKLRKYKSINQGKRCFIIGNGPSLKIEDLEMLKDEDCFAANRIFDLFGQTNWRPKYYCCHDSKLINTIKERFPIIAKESICFLSSILIGDIQDNNNIYFYYTMDPPLFGRLPAFSEDITKIVYGGGTILYACAQIAVYMGYKEIYFLGVDHNYHIVLDNNGDRQLDGSHSYAKGIESSTSNINFPSIDRTTKAYEKLKRYAKEHKITVKNLTRGGKLEVFERDTLENIINIKYEDE